MTPSEDPARYAGTDAWIAACLRREPGAARAVPEMDPAALVHRIVYHGLAGQLAGDRALMAALPAPLAQGLQAAARSQAFWELAHRRLLTRLAAAFAAAGIEPVVLKGTALAYSVYDTPASRPRGDTDLLVPEADYARAAGILEAEGLALAFAPAGQVVTSQCSYVLWDAHGLEHTVDLHRQSNNHAALAALFTYPELRAQAVPLDRLAPGLWRPGLVDALLFACAHRYMHVDAPITVDGVDHLSENRLVWLLDMARIGRNLAPEDWDVLVAQARGRGLLGICRGSLLAARDLAGLDLPAAVSAALEHPPADEAPMRFLRAGRGGRLLADLAATPGTLQKARFLRETILPPAAYMRAQFGRDGGDEGLVRLHLRRLAGGIARLLRGQGTAP